MHRWTGLIALAFGASGCMKNYQLTGRLPEDGGDGTETSSLDASDAPFDVFDATDAFDGGDASDAPPDVRDVPVDRPVVCDAATENCDNVCVDTNTDDNNCGGCGIVCTAVTGGTNHCVAGECSMQCTPPFEAYTSGCDVKLPQPLYPPSTAIMTSANVTFRWTVANGVDGAIFELCQDSTFDTCTMPMFLSGANLTTHTVSGLNPGVWYWRVEGRVAGTNGVRLGTVYEFVVPQTSSTPPSRGATVAGNLNDTELCGYSSGAVGAPIQRAMWFFVNFGLDMPGVPSVGQTVNTPAGSVNFGASVASAFDVNGDGYGDVIVGDPGTSGGGAAYVFEGYGVGAGIAADSVATLAAPVSAGARFGASVAGIGDFNGDGYGDVAVGAPNDGAGSVRLYLGGLGTDHIPATAASATWNGGATDVSFGASVAAAGDVNGDGLSDVIIGAPGANSGTGRVYLVLGSTSPSTSTPQSIDGTLSTGRFGASVSGAGDVNGDGFADVVVGAPGVGMATVYQGQSTGAIALAPLGTSLQGLAAGDSFGASVAGGDVNNDGYADVIVGAPTEGHGAVYVFAGSPTGALTTGTSRVLSPSAASFGTSVSYLGDSDGDGFGDVIVGAPVTGGTAPGVAYVFGGGASGLGSNPISTLSGTATTPDGFGVSVATRSHARTSPICGANARRIAPTR